MEQFTCNYGLNPEFRSALEKSGLVISGRDAEDQVRIFELPDHPFYLGTLFQPQLSSAPDRPHPLIVAFLKAAIAAAKG